jgi:uncharacterized protein YecE (DUF72 family)
MNRVWIGTSGWVYPHWNERFYPASLPAHNQLAFYAQHFPTVEINRSFYRLPSFEQFHHWAEQVAPFPSFRFAVKASRYLTHLKKLRDPQESLNRLLTAASGLGEHQGVLLLQLPPHWHADPGRLEHALSLLPAEIPAAIEVRDPSWFEPATLAQLEHILTRTGATLAIGVGGPTPTPPDLLRMGTFRYVRFHSGASDIGFTDAELAVWAERLAQHAQDGYEGYAYFNNDAEGHAIVDAQRFHTLLGPLAVAP